MTSKSTGDHAKRRQYFTTFCADYVKALQANVEFLLYHNKERMIDTRQYCLESNLSLVFLWIFDFAIDAQDDVAMPKYPKKWTDIKRYLQDTGACKEAFVASWAAYFIWKNGSINLNSFNRRKDYK